MKSILNTQYIRQVRGAFAFLIAAGTLMSAPVAWSETWIIDNNTTTLTSNDPLPTTDDLALGNETTAGHLDLGGFNQTVANFFVRSKANASVNTISIAPNRTFTVREDVRIGDVTESAFTVDNGDRTNLTLTGGGHFVAGDGINSAFVLWNANNRDFSGVVDLTGLASFTANLGEGLFSLRFASGNATTGLHNPDIPPTLKLAPDSSLTAGRLQIGGTNAGSPLSPPTLLLGTGETVLNIDEITLGAVYTGFEPGSGSGRLGFQSETEGTVTIRGAGGTNADRANLTVGGQLSGFAMAGGRSYARDFEADFAGHAADLLLHQLLIGEDDAIGNPAYGNRSGYRFRFDQGVLDVNELRIGRMNTTRATADVDGYPARSDSSVTLGGGAVTIHQGVDLARVEFLRAERSGVDLELNAALNIQNGTVMIQDGASKGWALRLASIGANALSPDARASGTLTLSGGILTVQGDIVHGGVAGQGTVESSIHLSGGRLMMPDHGIRGVDTFTMSGGTLSVGTYAGKPALVNRGGVLAPGGEGEVGHTRIEGDYTQEADGVLSLDIQNEEHFDSVHVTGSVTLAGTIRIHLDDGMAGPAHVDVLTSDEAITDRSVLGGDAEGSPAFSKELVNHGKTLRIRFIDMGTLLLIK